MIRLEVKWIKIATDIFDNKKIKQIECQPDGDSIIVVWFKLLCLAGNTNDSGMVYITKDIPYTEQMLSIQFNRPLDLVQNALNVFQKFGMIHIVDDILHVSNWEKYQNVDGLERIREQTRKRVEKHRNKNKLLQLDSCNVTCNATETQCNAIDKDIDKKENKNIIDTVVSMYNETCVSFPKCTAVSEKRKKSIKARLNNGYTVEDFKTVFDKAEASTFLKGGNKNDWKATFDWLISDGNFAKVLDGNYDNTSHFVDYSDPNRYSQKGW